MDRGYSVPFSISLYVLASIPLYVRLHSFSPRVTPGKVKLRFRYPTDVRAIARARCYGSTTQSQRGRGGVPVRLTRPPSFAADSIV